MSGRSFKSLSHFFSCAIFFHFLIVGTMHVCFHNRVALGSDILQYVVPGTPYLLCIYMHTECCSCYRRCCCYSVCCYIACCRSCCCSSSWRNFTPRTYHDLDHLVPHLPLWEVVQDLHSTDPTQETRTRPCRLYRSHSATWARSSKIGNISALKDLDHEMGIRDMSGLCTICRRFIESDFTAVLFHFIQTWFVFNVAVAVLCRIYGLDLPTSLATTGMRGAKAGVIPLRRSPYCIFE